MERHFRKFTNSHARTTERQRRNDDIDTRTILQTGIYQRRCFIQTSAKRRKNTVNDIHQMSIIVKLCFRKLQFSHAFDKYVLGPVNHDFGNASILQ